MKSFRENPDGEPNQKAEKQTASYVGGLKLANCLDLTYKNSHDAKCMNCQFEMFGGRDVELCPSCGSDRWYRWEIK